MIRRILMSDMQLSGKLMLNKTKKPQHFINHERRLSLPARKELQTNYADSPQKSKILASKCSHPEYEGVDYCTPLFP